VKHAAGLLRVEIEALLSQGLPNSPMAGAQIRVASGNYIAAKPVGVVDGVDFQFTGAVRKVDGVAIARRLEAGEVVLVPHIGYSPTGEVFNLAWEDVAENVARALKADKLLLYVDQLPTGAAADHFRAHRARSEALLKTAGLAAPTRRALEHGLRAVRSGVGRAHLVSRRAEGRDAAGAVHALRRRHHDHRRSDRKAAGRQKSTTSAGLLALIEPLEADGTLVKRNRERLSRKSQFRGDRA
jgi:amino-acid N-acetyltransferase